MKRTLQYLAIGVIGLALGAGTIPPAGAQAPTIEAEQLGDVRFPVSGAGEAPDKFHRAMALYHSFDWKGGKRRSTRSHASIRVAAWRFGAWR